MSQELARKLLERNRVGALLRIFANSDEIVTQQIASGLEAAKKLNELEISGKKVFSRIDFLVSNDDRFEDSDNGEITEKLRAAIEETFGNKSLIRVLNIQRGDIYCMLLNYGVVNQMEDRVPYSFIITHSAHNYITLENISSMLAAMQEKARVAGLQINNISELVQKGRVANTFAVWHNKSLMTVGGFDLRSAKPLKTADCNSVIGICTTSEAAEYKNQELLYLTAGCEEIIPLIRLTRVFGPCIKPIVAEDSDIPWGPRIGSETDEYKRHQEKLATKEARQNYFANLVGTTADFLQEGIIK